MVYESEIIFMSDSGLVKIKEQELKVEEKSEQNFCAIQDLVPTRQEEENALFGEDLNPSKMEDNSKTKVEKLLGIIGKLLQNRDLEGSRDFKTLAQVMKPFLEGSDQSLAVVEVLLAEEKQSNAIQFFKWEDFDPGGGAIGKQRGIKGHYSELARDSRERSAVLRLTLANQPLGSHKNLHCISFPCVPAEPCEDDRKEDGVLGVTDEVVDFVFEILAPPELWNNFPLSLNKTGFTLEVAIRLYISVMGKIKTKVEVFSYGVVLMELLTGLIALDEGSPEESRYLAQWFWRIRSSKEKLLAAIDPALDPVKKTFEHIPVIVKLAATFGYLAPEYAVVRVRFALLDTNINGKVTHKELMTGHQKIGSQLAEVEIKMLTISGNLMGGGRVLMWLQVLINGKRAPQLLDVLLLKSILWPFDRGREVVWVGLNRDSTRKEAHCPPEHGNLHYLIPIPQGYHLTPFPWPQSRDYVPYEIAPYKSLTVEKAIKNWIQYEDNVFRSPGGGTPIPHGVEAYINKLASSGSETFWLPLHSAQQGAHDRDSKLFKSCNLT